MKKHFVHSVSGYYDGGCRLLGLVPDYSMMRRAMMLKPSRSSRIVAVPPSSCLLLIALIFFVSTRKARAPYYARRRFGFSKNKSEMPAANQRRKGKHPASHRRRSQATRSKQQPTAASLRPRTVEAVYHHHQPARQSRSIAVYRTVLLSQPFSVVSYRS